MNTEQLSDLKRRAEQQFTRMVAIVDSLVQAFPEHVQTTLGELPSTDLSELTPAGIQQLFLYMKKGMKLLDTTLIWKEDEYLQTTEFYTLNAQLTAGLFEKNDETTTAPVDVLIEQVSEMFTELSEEATSDSSLASDTQTAT